MRTVSDLSHSEMACIVAAMQQALYLDFDSPQTKIWNPDKEWDGAEVCDQLAAELDRFGLVPPSVIPVTSHAP